MKWFCLICCNILIIVYCSVDEIPVFNIPITDSENPCPTGQIEHVNGSCVPEDDNYEYEYEHQTCSDSDDCKYVRLKNASTKNFQLCILCILLQPILLCVNQIFFK